MNINASKYKNKLRSHTGVPIKQSTRGLIAFGVAASLMVGIASAGGNESSGHEGGSESGGHSERREGSENSAGFVSDGLPRYAITTPSLERSETWAGLQKGIEVAATFDSAKQAFVGRVRNETGAAMCDVKLDVVLDGDRSLTKSNEGTLPGLASYGKANFKLALKGGSFTQWSVSVSSNGCISAPDPTVNDPEGSEGGGESHSSESGEGGGESHGSESGSENAESSSETSPANPLTRPYNGVFQNQNFNFAYDNTANILRGTVVNPTTNTICQSRTEIHLSSGGKVLELGPTIPIDLPPGAILNIVMGVEGYTIDSYALHPESSPCNYRWLQYNPWTAHSPGIDLYSKAKSRLIRIH